MSVVLLWRNPDLDYHYTGKVSITLFIILVDGRSKAFSGFSIDYALENSYKT